MRSAGAYTVQQTLTTEAASVLKHSLSLARRRGHSQVTPLHVASTLLITSRPNTLFRRAILKSQPNHHPHHLHLPHSHNLHCRALELCFNVSLNRLPTTPNPLLHGQPSLSNALIAALKRAQAHQRRGSIENQNHQQQQPILAIKVELEQLIISILDDPSVSRVMREAGFSSSVVKNNLEDISSSLSSSSSVFQCYNNSSGGVYSSPCSPSREISINSSNLWNTHFLNSNSEQNPVFISPQRMKIPNSPFTEYSVSCSSSVKEDIKLVLEVMLRKKRKNTVIVGDSLSITEGLVSDLMNRVERKEVPEELRNAHFIKFEFTSVSLKFMKREEVEMKLSDLKRRVDYSLSSSGGGVIVYTGDLKWTVLEREGSEREGGYYSPIDHLVEEIGQLVSEYNDNHNCSRTKVWLMGIANYQTYMKCQMRNPPLEIQWALQAVSVPSGGLGLSLHANSVHDSRINLTQNPSQIVEKELFTSKEEREKLTCCEECTSNYEKEAGLFKSPAKEIPSSLYISSSINTKDSNNGSPPLPYWLQSHNSESRQKDDLVELRRKWNRLCQSLHQGRNTLNHLNSSSFSNQSHRSWWPNPSNVFPDSSSISFADSNMKPNHIGNSLPKFRRQQSCHIEFSLSNENHKNHQSEKPNLDYLKNTEGKELKITLALGNSLSEEGNERKIQDGKILKILQENVPWQIEESNSIFEALGGGESMRKENWLLIEGSDFIGKRRLGLAIAESVFGSSDLVFHINIRNRCDRTRPWSEILERELRNREKLVVLVENVDFADTKFVKFLSDGFESGNFGELSKREGSLAEVVFVLTKGDSTSYEDEKENPNSVMQMKLEVAEIIQNSGEDKFDRKRKVDSELPKKVKSPRIDKSEEIAKQFTRQLSSNTLDLNMKANEEDDNIEEKLGEFSPISSDLTGETSNGLENPLGFLDKIKKRFTFNSNSVKDSQMREMFLSQIKGCFKDLFGSEKMGLFTVDDFVLEEVLVNSGFFLHSLFENWLKDVFQTSLKTVKFGGKENISVRLCLGGGQSESSGLEDGFMGSSLPKKIQIYCIS